MEQTRLAELLQNFQSQCAAENNLCELSVAAGQPDMPIVVLVHGIGGNAKHWSDPLNLNVNDTWLFDLNSNPPKNTKGIATSLPYHPDAAKSWTQFLSENRFSYVNFSQCHPSDLLQYAVTELSAILSYLEKLVFQAIEQEVATNGGSIPPMIILCHSRGGLVTRATLKQLGNSGVPHLRKVISLCTPHQGSYMPKLSNDYNNTLHQNINFDILGNIKFPPPIQGFLDNVLEKNLNDVANKVREAISHSFGAPAMSAGFDELIPGSDMLNNLVQDEQPLPGVQYFGFTGTNPTFVKLFLCELGKVINILEVSSLHLLEVIGKVADSHQSYGDFKEMSEGDSAVAINSANWPPQFNAPQQSFHINHMQALIDSGLQNTVLGILKSN
jgi:pimeloyl-ACP methyl ester carboxylesterase